MFWLRKPFSIVGILFAFLKEVLVLLSCLEFPAVWTSFNSIFGSWDSVFHNREPLSEYRVIFSLSRDNLWVGVKYFCIFVFSFFFPIFGFLPFFLQYLLRGRTHKTVVQYNALGNEYPEELWLFVNGVGMDNELGTSNARHLSRIFKRKIEFVHNPTHGLFFDLIECVIGRTFNKLTPPGRELFKTLRKTLPNRDYSKIVLIGHSQGGIILSEALDFILFDVKFHTYLEKLEVYTFASAADEHPYITIGDQTFPFYEHYANDGDLVCKSGVLWPMNQHQASGTVFQLDQKGHLLSAHYLPAFERKRYKDRSGDAKSRLYSYLSSIKR